MKAIKRVIDAIRNNSDGLSIKTSLDDDVSSTIKRIEDKIDKISPCSVATTDLSSRVIVEITNQKECKCKSKCSEITKKQNTKKRKSNSKKMDISFLSKPEKDCFDNIIETYNNITTRFKSVDTISDDMYDLCFKEIDVCINLIKAFTGIIETYQDDRYNVIIDHVNVINDEIYEDKFGLQIRKKYLKVYNEFNNIINKILDLKHTHSGVEDYTYNVCKQCIPDYLPSPLKFKSNIKNVNKIIEDINDIINDTVNNKLRKSFIEGALTYINRLEQINTRYNFIYSKIVKMKRRITDTEMTIVIGVIDYINENQFKDDVDKDVKKKLSKKASIKFKKLKTKYEITYAIKIQKIVRGYFIRYNWGSIKRAYINRKKIIPKECIQEKHNDIKHSVQFLDQYKENLKDTNNRVPVHDSIKKEISLMANLYREKIFFDRQKFYYSTKTKQLHEREIF